MGVAAIVWGILSLVGTIIAFMPCFGALNWLTVPFAGVGLIISIIAANKPETKNHGIGGIVMCGFAVVIGVLRLYVGGGII